MYIIECACTLTHVLPVCTVCCVCIVYVHKWCAPLNATSFLLAKARTMPPSLRTAATTVTLCKPGVSPTVSQAPSPATGADTGSLQPPEHPKGSAVATAPDVSKPAAPAPGGPNPSTAADQKKKNDAAAADLKKKRRKFREMCLHKPTTGKLEVPENVWEQYQLGGDTREDMFKCFVDADGKKDCWAICENCLVSTFL